MQAVSKYLNVKKLDLTTVLFDSSQHDPPTQFYPRVTDQGPVLMIVELTSGSTMAAYASNIPHQSTSSGGGEGVTEVRDRHAVLFHRDRWYTVNKSSTKAPITLRRDCYPSWGSKAFCLGELRDFSGLNVTESQFTFPGWPGSAEVVKHGGKAIRRVVVHKVGPKSVGVPVESTPGNTTSLSFALSLPPGTFDVIAVSSVAPWVLAEVPQSGKRYLYPSVCVAQQQLKVLKTLPSGFSLVLGSSLEVGWVPTAWFGEITLPSITLQVGTERALVQTEYPSVRPRVLPTDDALKCHVSILNTTVDVLATCGPYSLVYADLEVPISGWVKKEYLVPAPPDVSSDDDEPSPVGEDGSLSFARCASFDGDKAALEDVQTTGSRPPSIPTKLQSHCDKGEWNEVLEFLSLYPCVNVPLPSGQRLLHFAASQGNGHVCDKLVTLGADSGLLNVDGHRPLDIAVNKFPDETDLHNILTPTSLTVSTLLRREAHADPSGTFLLESTDLLKLAAVFTDVVVPPTAVGACQVMEKLRAAVGVLYGESDRWLAFLSRVQQSLGRSLSTFIGYRKATRPQLSQFYVVSDLLPVGDPLRTLFALTPLPLVEDELVALLRVMSIPDSVQVPMVERYNFFLNLCFMTDQQDQCMEQHGLRTSDQVVVPVERPLAPAGDEVVRWIAIGDWGENVPALDTLTSSMAQYAQRVPQDFILMLGDNFYPSGVRSVRDPLFRTLFTNRFLVHPSLRVPYKVILGNHDVYGSAEAQLEYTNSTENLNGLWQMTGDDESVGPSRYYHFSAGKPNNLVEFFGLDTNAAQNHHVKLAKDPMTHGGFVKEVIPWLTKKLKDPKVASTPWRVAYGHHPMYTIGSGHQDEARRLRLKSYVSHNLKATVNDGFGFESVLHEGKVDLYLAGHEHVMQLHRGPQLNPDDPHRIQHCIAGATLVSHYYKGRTSDEKLDWEGRYVVGFVACEARRNTLTIKVIDCRTSKVAKEVVLKK
eukprot:PhF_6_TR25488/c0_g1_i2/m.35438